MEADALTQTFNTENVAIFNLLYYCIPTGLDLIHVQLFDKQSNVVGL